MALPLVTLTGNLTEDPELKYTANATALLKLRIACSDRRKDQATGQWVDGKTTFIDVVAWRDLAEAAGSVLGRGDKVTISGKLTMNTYTAKDGTERTTYEVNADTIAAPITAMGRQTVTRNVTAQPVLSDEEPF